MIGHSRAPWAEVNRLPRPAKHARQRPEPTFGARTTPMAKLTDETRASLRRRSRLVNLGRDAEFSQGFINVPAFRGSTVLYPDVATLKNRAQRFTYGTRGTPTTEALCSAWTDLSDAAGTVLVPSGPARRAAPPTTRRGPRDWRRSSSR